MNELAINNDKVRVTEVGLEFRETLSNQEWTDLGRKIGRVAKASMFMIGDWIIHGEQALGGGVQRKTVPEEIVSRYEIAAQITGLEIRTLENAAVVCRNVPLKSRRRDLYFEHHKEVAKLTSEDQTSWLDTAEKHGMGTRRLRKSIMMGRIVTPEEMQADPADRAIETFNPWVNRICILYGKFKDTGYMKATTKEKREAMRRDLLPVVEIYEELGR